MAKGATLSAVPSYLPGATSASAINDSDDKLNTAFDNTLSRDGSTPNQMTADFDVNNNDILNCNELNVCKITLDGESVVTVAAAIPTLHGVRVWTNTTQTIPFDTVTITFENESYQLVDGETVTTMHSTTSNNSRLIVDRAGYWEIMAQWRTSLNTPEFEGGGATLWLNGAVSIAHSASGDYEPSAANDATVSVQVSTGPILLAVDDYITLKAFINPTNNLSKAGEFNTWFTMRLIATA